MQNNSYIEIQNNKAGRRKASGDNSATSNNKVLQVIA